MGDRYAVFETDEAVSRNRGFHACRGAGVLGRLPILHEHLQHHAVGNDSQGNGKECRHHRRTPGGDSGQHRLEAVPCCDTTALAAILAPALCAQSLLDAALVFLEAACSFYLAGARATRVSTGCRRIRG